MFKNVITFQIVANSSAKNPNNIIKCILFEHVIADFGPCDQSRQYWIIESTEKDIRYFLGWLGNVGNVLGFCCVCVSTDGPCDQSRQNWIIESTKKDIRYLLGWLGYIGNVLGFCWVCVFTEKFFI